MKLKIETSYELGGEFVTGCCTIYDDRTAPKGVDGIRANMNSSSYMEIQLPDFEEESLGTKVISIILDRLFK